MIRISKICEILCKMIASESTIERWMKYLNIKMRWSTVCRSSNTIIGPIGGRIWLPFLRLSTIIFRRYVRCLVLQMLFRLHKILNVEKVILSEVFTEFKTCKVRIAKMEFSEMVTHIGHKKLLDGNRKRCLKYNDVWNENFRKSVDSLLLNIKSRRQWP